MSMESKAKLVNFIQKNYSIIFLCLIYVVGLLLRLLFVWKNPMEPYDAVGYIEIAEFMIGVEGTSYSFPREPLFSFMLGLVFLIFPSTFLTTRLFTAILGSVNIVLVYLVAKKYLKKFFKNISTEKFALVSSLLISLNYQFILKDGYGYREPLYTILFLILLYSILMEKKVIKRVLFCTTSFLMILTKSESLILLIGISIFLFQKENFLTKSNNNLKQIDSDISVIDSSENEQPDTGIKSVEDLPSQKNKKNFRNFVSNVNYNFAFILLGLVVGYCLWMILSSLLFGDPFATSNEMAKLYYRQEFGIIAPEDLTTFSYIFTYHGILELFQAFYSGFFVLFSDYEIIYGIYLFAFFILSLISLLIKGDYISLFSIFYPPLFIGLLAYFWDPAGYARILLPYSTIGLVVIPIFTYNILEKLELMITNKVKIRIKRNLFFYLIIGFICLKSILRLLDMFIL